MHVESNDKSRIAYRAVSAAFMKLDKTQLKIAECLAGLQAANSEDRRRDLRHRHDLLEVEWQKDYHAYVEANRAYLRETGHPQ
jgi:hypothetical protein